MATTRQDWLASVEDAWPARYHPPPESPAAAVVPLVGEFIGLHVLLLANDNGLDAACRRYVDHALSADRPAWAAAGRALWAQGLMNHGDEESAHLQLVLAELELQRELSAPRPEPEGGPTGAGSAHNNLGDAYMMTRAFEMGILHFRNAVRESEANYAGQLWLQHLVDHSNLSVALVRWALHLDAVMQPVEARRAAAEAWVWAQRFAAVGEQYQRLDAIALATLMGLGARSLLTPHAIGAAHVLAVQNLCDDPLFGDDLSAPMASLVLARLSRLTHDDQRCRAAVDRVVGLSRPGDEGIRSLARREMALMMDVPRELWEYTDSVVLQAEVGRRRVVDALRTRAALTGLEERYQRVAAQRQLLQVQLEAARHTESELLFAATHDPLTGLPNRRLFEERAHEALTAADDAGLPVAIGLLDLDDLKLLNDQHGHTAGDAALQTVGHTLLKHVGPGDTVARLGGDEFAFILTRPGEAGALQDWARALSAALDVTGSTVSIGVCLATRVEGRSRPAMLQVADAQMYRAKRAGKGLARVEVLHRASGLPDER